MGLIVNLDEFSELCGVTAETMRGYIRGVEGHPGWLVERGDRGRGYKIEAEGGLRWWKALRDQADADAEDHRDRMAQLRLDILGHQADTPEALALSGKQRRDEYAAVMDRLKLRRAMGELIERAEIEPLLTHAAVEHRRRLMLVPGEYAASAGLTPEDIRPLEQMLERAVAEFVDGLAAMVPGDA